LNSRTRPKNIKLNHAVLCAIALFLNDVINRTNTMNVILKLR